MRDGKYYALITIPSDFTSCLNSASSKEKQISTFLECKKTFFGKVKYFFKYSGKKAKKRWVFHHREGRNRKREPFQEPCYLYQVVVYY